MLDKPNCYARNCIHFTGVIQDDDEDGNPIEATERPACAAFPHGIPYAIAYGNNLHLRPYPGDNGIQYEEAKDVDKRANPRLNNAGFNVPFWAIWCSSPHW